jgi:hypothetical protein
MNKSDVAAILAKISAYDRRTVGEADIEAWAEALTGRVTVQDALTAVRDHFRESKEWLMPVDVIKRSAEIRRRRVRDAGVPEIPADLTAAQERRWLAVYWESINSAPYEMMDGRGTLETASFHANRALGITEVAAVMLKPDEVKAKLASLIDANAKSLPTP